MKRFYIFFLILLVPVIFYANSFQNSFQYDDQTYIEENINLRTAGLSDVFLQPSSLFSPDTVTGHYRPLVFFTYVLNYRLNKLNPSGYHFINLLFHIGAAIILFRLIEVMLGRHAYKNSLFIAMSSTMIFAIHPFNSEAINYITARSSVMSGFFYLLAFYFWVKFRKVEGRKGQVEGSGRQVEGRNETKTSRSITGFPATSYLKPSTYYVACFIAFILGMLSKEVVITLPLMLVIYDLYFVPSQARDMHSWIKTRLRMLIPLTPFVFVVIVPYIILRIMSWGSVFPASKRPFLIHLYTELPVITKYLRLFIFPAGLSINHDVEIYKTFIAAPVVLSALVLTGCMVWTIYTFMSDKKEWRIASFFFIWFFVVLLPTTFAHLNDILQENRGYLAIIFFAFLVSVVLGKLKDYTSNSYASSSLKWVPTGILVMVLLLYGLGTVHRNKIWRDEVSLWSDAAMKSPKSSKAHTNLGIGYAKRGENERAIKEYRKALRFVNTDRGENPVAIHYNIGTLYQQAGKLDLAVMEYKKVAEIAPSDFRPYYNLGVIYQQRGEAEKAIELYKEALKRSPSNFRTFHNLGLIFQNRGELESAEEFYRKAIILNPDYARSHFNLGLINEENGEINMARQEYIETLRLDPDYTPAYESLGTLYEKEGDFPMAVKFYKEAFKRNPEDRSINERIRNLERKLDTR